MFSVLDRIRPRTLRLKLLFWYTGVFAVSSVSLVFTTYLIAAHQMRKQAEVFLDDESADQVRESSDLLPDVERLAQRLRGSVHKRRYYPPYYRLLDGTTGRVLLCLPQPGPEIALDSEAVRRAVQGRALMQTVFATGDKDHPYYIRTVSFQANGRTYVLQTGIYLKWFESTLEDLRIYLAPTIPVILLIAVIGGLVFAGRSLRPVREAARQLREIRATDLSRRLPEAGSADEFGSLIDAVNGMLGELESSFARVRSFTADVAHELRTPLTTLICELEVALGRKRTPEEYRNELAAVLERSRRLAHVVEDLLFLARTDSADEVPQRTEFDLEPVLQELEESFGLVAESKGVGLRVEQTGPLRVLGNREWLRIVVANLLDNSIKYTASGGEVRVSASGDKDAARVRVEDSGIGIAAEDIERIFDRFYRTDESRSRDTGGIGLGLSIARRIVELHHGTISVTSEPGKGSRFEVVLPAGPEAGTMRGG